MKGKEEEIRKFMNEMYENVEKSFKEYIEDYLKDLENGTIKDKNLEKLKESMKYLRIGLTAISLVALSKKMYGEIVIGEHWL